MPFSAVYMMCNEKAEGIQRKAVDNMRMKITDPCARCHQNAIWQQVCVNGEGSDNPLAHTDGSKLQRLGSVQFDDSMLVTACVSVHVMP